MNRTVAILSLLLVLAAVITAHDALAVRGWFGCVRVESVMVGFGKFGIAPGGRYECDHGTWDIKE